MRDKERQPVFVSVIDRQPPMAQAIPADEGATIGDLLGGVRRHLWFIAVCAAVGVLLSLLYIRLKPPVYEASAELRIDPKRADSLAIADRPAAMPSESGEELHTEIVILKSDDVAIRTLNTLTPEEFAAFTGEQRGAGLIPQDVQALSKQQQNWLLKLKRSLTVKQIDGTQLMSVTVRHIDPRSAAAVANAVIQAYNVQTFEDRGHSIAELRTWLSGQMNDLKNHAAVAQTKLTDFEEANNVVATEGTSNTIADRLRFLSERLSALQSDRIMKEAQMRAASNGSPSELATLFPNPKINTLQADQGTLYAKYAQLSSKFGPNYPPLADLENQMRRIDAEIKDEVQSIRERLRTEYAGAEQAQEMLQAEYDQQIAAAFRFNHNQAEYAVLQSDVTSSKELYEALRRKLQQATVDAEVGGLNTVLVQRARVPMEPAGPRNVYILLGSLVVGLFAGVVAVVIFDGASDRVWGAQQVEQALRVPVLARLPRAFKDVDLAKGHGRATRASLPLGAPSSKTIEAIRALRNSLVLSAEVKTVLVTSGNAEEGAFPVAVDLAILLARCGAKVLLVDTDLHKPRAQDAFDIDNGPGLGEFLSDESFVPTPIRPMSRLQNLFIVTGGDTAITSADLLTSTVFHSLIKKWRNEFDYVVLIGTPLLVTNVGMPLATWVDTTVLMAQIGHSRTRELKQIRDTLLRNGARIQGVVISDVPRRSINPGKAAQRAEARYVYPELAKEAQGSD
jgi:polysaccharide biosynthesis transport protein